MKRFYLVLLVLALALIPFSAASAATPFSSYALAGPVFGMDAAPNGNLLVADSGYGIVELRRSDGQGTQIARLPGVSDVASIDKNTMFAITGAGDPNSPAGALARKLFRVSMDGKVQQIADLGAFEDANNPDKVDPPDSNPFDVEALDAQTALVADAGGNDLLKVDMSGNIQVVAVLPEEVVSTDNVKKLVGCPNAPADFADICGLPPMIPAQPVATSIAIGPDGAYYVGELKGFPFPTGASRVWRIAPDANNAQCGTSDKCSVVASGFTSIVDLSFGPNGTLYVTEIDEASAGAVELGIFNQVPGVLKGGTVNACRAMGESKQFACAEAATGLTTPTATAIHGQGNLYVTDSSLTAAQVLRLK